jgi:carbonic anhydrase/acetyltransferase-like protein (isoleucine patch superfamily)
MIKSCNGKIPQIHPTAFVSEAAYVVGDVQIGEYSSVWPGAVIRGDFARIVIGKNTAIEDNCVLHTPERLEIGDNVTIGHSVTVHCRKVGSNCLLGIGAILLNGAEVGDYCLIAAGTLVPPNTVIPDRSLVMGSPGKVKPLPEERLLELKSGASAYADLAQEYKKAGL